ncbi:hypothetical protein DFJ74DRAFT_101509 [Hyaloraphidium curvatum]|nr:hypothetical protein DFJ74DRAFT_101509 [Hyaloraphidium curvatum]
MSFTDAELLALLPSPLPPASADEPNDEGAQRAKAVRAADALSRKRLLADLAAVPALRWLLALQRLPRVNHMPITRTVFGWAPWMAVMATTWTPALDSGMFDVRGAAVGLTAQMFLLTLYHVALVSNALPVWNRPPSDDANIYAGAARWVELCAGCPDSSLVEHRPDNKDCTCPQPSCAGNTLRNSAAIQFGKLCLTMTGISLGVIVFLYWTPFVALGGYTWTVPWRIFIMVATIVSQTILCLLFIGQELSPDPALLELDARLDVRAIRLSLAGLPSGSVTLPASVPSASPTLPDVSAPPPPPAYITVYQTLAPKWRRRVQASETFVGVVASTFPLPVIALLLNLLGAGCAPAYLIALVVFHTLELLYFAAAMAVANAGVFRCAALYSRAALAIRVAYDSKGEEPPHSSSNRAAVLDGFAREAEDNCARIFGVAITFSAVRGIVVTLVTVGVGLFGILRGAGARATLQSWCLVA